MIFEDFKSFSTFHKCAWVPKAIEMTWHGPHVKRISTDGSNHTAQWNGNTCKRTNIPKSGLLGTITIITMRIIKYIIMIIFNEEICLVTFWHI